MTREEALKQWLPIVVMGVREMPEVKEAVKMAITALEQQPSSSENPNKWIPVDDRLPEIHNFFQLYLVTYKQGKICTAFYTETNGRSWWSIDGVEAWMELPEPYQPEIPTGEEGRVDKDGGEENAG